MTPIKAVTRRDPREAGGEVVAGLVNGDCAFPVAEAAVARAGELGCAVRFVHVETVPWDADAESDGVIFAAATRALRSRDVPATFEVVRGDSADILLERSRTARALVVGADRPWLVEDPVEPSTTRGLVDQAGCEVHVVAPTRARVPLSQLG